MKQAAAMVGALAWPRKILELSVSLVDGSGAEWETPKVVFCFENLVHAEGEAEVKSAAKAKPTKLQPDALKRVRKELRLFNRECPTNAAFGIGEKGDPAFCEASVLGPVGTPFEGGVFRFEYHYPDNYPFSPPKLRCLTKIFHCNVNSGGDLCGIPQLKDAWSPQLTCIDILQALSSLLMSPNFGEPLVAEIAALNEKDPKAHDAQAATTTKLYAAHTPDPSINWASVQLDARKVPNSNDNDAASSVTLSAEEVNKALSVLEADWKPAKWELLEADRRARYAARVFPSLKRGSALKVSTSDAAEEKIVSIVSNRATEVLGCDSVSLEDVTPCQLVEYRFSDTDWMVARISVESLEYYRVVRFAIWHKMAMNMWRDCISSFKRIVRGGPICHMFDNDIFLEADGEEKKWQVVDKYGKVRLIPHPVAGLRVWRPETQSYEAIDTRLTGAPSDEELQTYWQGMLAELEKVTFNELGGDFMGDCNTLSEEDLLKKYA
jgi:ubiquitin-conjugating enzyme E2 D/E